MKSNCFRSGRWSLLCPQVIACVGLAPQRGLLLGRLGVGAVERDRGRVVVQLVELHAELRDGVSRDRQVSEATSASKSRSRQRPTRSSLRWPHFVGGESEHSGDDRRPTRRRRRAARGRPAGS